MTQTKRCSCCGKMKSIEDFHLYAKGKDGRQCYCKPCSIAKARSWQKRDRAVNGSNSWRTAQASRAKWKAIAEAAAASA